MDKKAYLRLICEYNKHRIPLIRSKSIYLAKVFIVGILIAYTFQKFSNFLLILSLLLLVLRVVYVLGRGDWEDLASQFGLKCWKCDRTFKSDISLKSVVDNNACPYCHEPVYEENHLDTGGSVNCQH